VSDAKKILDERLAKGEISDTEYDRLSSKIAAELQPTGHSIQKTNFLKFLGSWKFILIIALIGAVGKLSARYFDRRDYRSIIVGDWACAAKDSGGEQLNIKMAFNKSRYSWSVLLDNETSLELESSGTYTLKVMDAAPHLVLQVETISINSNSDGGTNVLVEVHRDYSFTLRSAIINGTSNEADARELVGSFIEDMKADNSSRIVELARNKLILSEGDGTGNMTCSH